MGLKITGAELEIMQYLWQKETACTFAELLEYFNTQKKKDWCRQTLNTCLLRLRKKGLLKKEKIEKTSFYIPVMNKVQYDQVCANEILQEAYGGMLSNFIAALTGKEKITELEKEELLEYIWSEK